MVTKGFQQLMAEAVSAVEQMSPADALALQAGEGAVFIDVREPHEVEQGRIPNALHVPRAFLEMMADPAMPAHNPAFSSGRQLVVYCGSGARSALAAKALTDMGLDKVANLSGGIQGWMQSGGPVER